MVRKTLALLTAAAMLSVCGLPDDTLTPRTDPDAPLLQVSLEGGLVPVEWILGQGPIYTLLSDGRLIMQGPTIAIYPGPLLPNYLVVQLGDEDMSSILDLVEEIGLPAMTEAFDNSAATRVADAGTQVVTYWDENGAHTYSVYALGIIPDQSNPSTAAFAKLLSAIDQAAAKADAVAWEPERVRVLAGVSQAPADPLLGDIREWPLTIDDPADWFEFEFGWSCKVFEAEVLDEFASASQVTQWLHPNPMMDAPPFTLLVRPLHPGEADCRL